MTNDRAELIAPPGDPSSSGIGPGLDPGTVAGLSGASVVLAALGGSSAEGLMAAIEAAGASVRVTSNFSGARCSNAMSGPYATVVIEPPAVTGAIRAGVAMLSRHGAVLLLSVNATTRERIDLLNSGADTVLASVDPGEVVAAVGALLRRSRWRVTRHVPEIMCAGDISVHLLQRIATTAGRTLTLTPLEFDLLAYFVAHAGEALSRDQLLKNVWGYDIGGRDTVTVHVRRLRQKLEVDPSMPTHLQTVWGIGYRFDPSSPLASAVRGDVHPPAPALHPRDDATGPETAA